MDIFKDHIHNTLFAVNHKSGCTAVLCAFLKEMGLLRDALRFSIWPHNYRAHVHNPQYPFTQDDIELPILKVVRNPFLRAVSSFFHSRLVDRWSSELSKIKCETFRQFIFLMKQHIELVDDPHLAPQFKLFECEFPNLIVCQLEDGLQQALDALNKAAGTSYSAEGIPNIEFNRSTLDPELTECVADKPYPFRPMLCPSYNLFYDDQLRADVAEIYAIDFEKYGYDFTFPSLFVTK